MRKKERFRIGSFTNPSGQAVYRVSGYLPSGRQVRLNFEDYDQALAMKVQLEIQALNQSVQVSLKSTRLTDEQLAQAETAFERLQQKPLLAAVDFFLDHYPSSIPSKIVREAVAEFLESKRSNSRLRPRTLRDYASRLNLLQTYDSRLVSELELADLEELIFKPTQSARTGNGNRRVLHSFFAWCCKKGYTQSNPIAKIDCALVDDAEPEILSLQQIRALLQAATEFKHRVMLPYLVLALYAGLRPKELARINWGHIDLSQKLIRVGADVAKTRQRRLVEMPDNLVQWLAPEIGRPLVGSNWRRHFDSVRRRAGFKGSWVGTADEALAEWPPDGLRHTALSYHFAWTKSETETAAWAGNSPGTLHGFYRGLVTKQEAACFFSWRPGNLELPPAA